ncbi:hypothetical protein GDO78_022462 [Eleutherodactylus coqui]|uniref:Uncharacterized protein n=1 Tax=Eleutherodactylus coqui TaxID=57060 RepID=A0A8J6E7J8_ELECQ|nr:hypothetical protein GDO78_022462 [Eleutherodactylus coqui]
MKAAFALLLVALSCYFGTGNTGGVSTSPIPIYCLQKLIRVDIPLSLQKLQELLCMFCKAKVRTCSVQALYINLFLIMKLNNSHIQYIVIIYIYTSSNVV